MSLDVDRSFRPYAEILLRWLKSHDPSFHVTSARRSRTVQERLWRDYQAGKSPFTAAPPGCSKHELGLAIDVVSQRRHPKDDPYLHALGRWWRSIGGEWGGEADPIHFALPGKICT